MHIGKIVFEPSALIGPSNGESGLQSTKAQLPIGELAADDVVIAVIENRKIVGSIVRFVKSSQIDAPIRAQLQTYVHVGDYIGTSIVSDWEIDSSSAGIVEIDASTIVAAPMWARRSKHIIIVVELAML